jgi:hypothetical protein
MLLALPASIRSDRTGFPNTKPLAYFALSLEMKKKVLKDCHLVFAGICHVINPGQRNATFLSRRGLRWRHCIAAYEPFKG